MHPVVKPMSHKHQYSNTMLNITRSWISDPHSKRETMPFTRNLADYLELEKTWILNENP